MDTYLKRAPGKPLKKGTVVNRLEVVEMGVAFSEYYRRYYFDGTVKCKCLGPPDGSGCGKEIVVSRNRIQPTRPEDSKYSCGECCKRPRRKYRLKKKRVKSWGGGRKVTDIKSVSERWGDLKVTERIRGKGWRCTCLLCKGWCIVPKTYQLLRGTITACSGCRPWEWEGKRGRKPKDHPA